MTAIRVLVTGARDWPEQHRNVIWRALDGAADGHEHVTVIEGECPQGGADLYARQWAEQHGATVEPYPADWRRYGGHAGPIRNTAMVRAGADLCLAFPRKVSVGTWDCVRKARAAGIRTIVIALEEQGAPTLF